MPKAISEADVEENVLAILESMGYKIIRGDNEDCLPGGSSALRADYKDVVLVDRLTDSLRKINPSAPIDALDQAIKQVLRSESQKLIANNESFHKMLVDGIDIPVQTLEGETYKKIWLFDFEDPENNEFLAVNQFTVVENNIERRPDVILFVNGIPLLVIELKNLADENATIWTAYDQLQTYKEQLPSLFKYNEILVISDGIEARAGTLTSERERFAQWKTIDGGAPRKGLTEIEVLIRGMCNKQRFLDIVRNFIVFEKDKSVSKKLAAYHQYWAVNKALESTIKARKGNKKAGIVWHTQGSGKSLTMVFYTGKLVRELDNPTVVVLTDRNDLDDQLFGTFSRCQDIIRQEPQQANSRKELQDLLKVSSGGIVFTTIQKFLPEEDNREKYPVLSERDNIVVIADEAHRSQYGFAAKILNKDDKTLITYGYAKYLRDALPNASFIGFTGTPIEKADRSTPAVFGKYVDTYDIEQAVNDGATVRIYYESRLAKLELKPEERPKIDSEFEEVTEGEEVEGKEKLKSKWARVEKVAGAPMRIKRIAKDIVDHFEKRTSVLEGKGMIVCMSRRICVELYNEIVELRPEWKNSDDEKGAIKVVMTGSASDPKEWQEHIRNKIRRKRIGDNFKDPKHELRLIIVRDMFLTGYDAPSLHTMYLDKPMKGHTLMQAIARVNRVYPGKEGGLIVDYMGVGAELKKALMDYTASGGKGKPAFDQEKAVMMMVEKYEVVKDMFHGFNYRKFFELKPSERISFIPQAMEHILKEPGKKERYAREVTALLKAFSLAVPHDRAMKIKEEVGLFQAIKSAIAKTTETGKESQEEKFDSAIKQILSKAVISDRIIDIFEAAGIQKPELSILSDGFLAEVKDMPQKNLAFEALKKLLNDEIRFMSKRNLVQAKSFMEMLDKTIKKYTNRNVEAAQVIEELIELAKKVRAEKNRAKEQNMSEDELAFYDALEVNDSAVKILGDETLRKIAVELTQMIRNSVTIDWTQRESVQAAIRLNVKKILRKYGYPPDKEKKATETVLRQAELVAKNWVSG
ncbi:type I site-specific deoxyribonuclease, HsdR family [Candidatus Nitrososphaera gargensis Ga9.2]|uniref:type I site-specific deoxyribonuclease n=1 Tax=Nitrososphaera gargensis (strain Ga9.2) TaxID=1237085 RepID=K0INR5_NITGG|nr:type I restriction endonuclease subunit R [Candidatus Nitrososphaera gargensis]AFU59834.1 type I site-specific deoxyribonuclease, HsdR family [Candidatus Nitrososphaera gargensis Ga9.2]